MPKKRKEFFYYFIAEDREGFWHTLFGETKCKTKIISNGSYKHVVAEGRTFENDISLVFSYKVLTRGLQGNDKYETQKFIKHNDELREKLTSLEKYLKIIENIYVFIILK